MLKVQVNPESELSIEVESLSESHHQSQFTINSQVFFLTQLIFYFITLQRHNIETE